MAQIPLQEPLVPDIYSYNFDKNLNRGIVNIESPIVYNNIGDVRTAALLTASSALSGSTGVYTTTNVARGQSSKAGTTGNQAITGVGFTPRWVMIWCVGAGSNYGTGAQVSSFGTATSSSNRSCTWFRKIDTGSSIGQEGNLIVRFVDGTPATVAAADFVSMDTDGFTINWTTTNTDTKFFEWIAIR